jgi:hypothetical protein
VVEEEEDAVEEKEEEGGGGRRRRRPTLIKSNNPHLAGGEKKPTYFGIVVFQNSKIIGLFRCHWGGPKKVDRKSIRYVFVQTKDVYGQKSKIIDFFDFGSADLRACGATLTVILVVMPPLPSYYE